MGPDKEALMLADCLIEKFKINVNRYELAYAIQEFAEENFMGED